MRFHSAILAALTVSALVSIGCASPCPGRPGIDWTEGEVVVRFAATVSSEDDARAFIVAKGLTVAGFLASSTPITAIANTPKGDECAVVSQLDAEPVVDSASLRYIAHANSE